MQLLSIVLTTLLLSDPSLAAERRPVEPREPRPPIERPDRPDTGKSEFPAPGIGPGETATVPGSGSGERACIVRRLCRGYDDNACSNMRCVAGLPLCSAYPSASPRQRNIGSLTRDRT